MSDLVIRGGTIVDGTGAPARRGDVAIANGRITAIGDAPARGAREIDAGGLVVAPGFIDVHTHYDAQYTWDPYATSSIWHGVTTTVIGNCGFAIAPCRPADRELIMRTLVKVEGMSLAAMRAGITWGFETFPEYLDHLERCNPSLNVAALVGHSTIRQWVMGKDSQHRVATSEEVAAMSALVREAMAAGAIGLGSSTAEAHVGDGGLPVASRLADKAEFLALTRAMGDSGRGVFQATIGPKTTMGDLREIWQTSGRPVIWAAFFQRDDRPEYVPERLATTEAFHREGVEVLPQISCRPLTMDFTMRNPYPFEGMPAWQRVMAEPESRWLHVYGDPQFRAALKADLAAQRFAVFRGRWDLVQVLRTSRPEHKALEGTSLADLARTTGKHPVDAWLDLVTADGLDVEFLAGLLNTDEKVVGDLIAHPLTLITLSDAGAHLSLMCDAGYSSTLLGKWVRDLGRLSLEAAVKRLTADPARAYRIPERGRLAPGAWADVVVFDPATIDALPAEWVTDLPAGEPRFVSRARGVEWSLVNGEPVLERGRVLERPAGARPGRVLRRFDP
ncbi:MAG TPA: amidohydrolase family protein [Terriglobales bacterium]|nr:amidohydrolase family protein [Terriglobales bacterium]